MVGDGNHDLVQCYPFVKIGSKMAFLDALIIYTAEQHSGVRTFISWNARHFYGKTPLAVLTPAEYLEGLPSS